jgi:hypothetical protein
VIFSRSLLAVLLAGVLAFAAAGCGDDGGLKIAAGSANNDKAQSDADTALADGGDTPDDTPSKGPAGGGTTDLCLGSAYFAAAMTMEQSSGTGTNDAEDLKKYFEEVAKHVPDAIKDDYRVFAEGFSKYAAAIENADENNPTEMLKALQILTEPAYAEASENINSWMEANC